MTHRSELGWLYVTDSTEKIREKVEENLFNIYPVASEKFDNIVGVVYLKDLFAIRCCFRRKIHFHSGREEE